MIHPRQALNVDRHPPRLFLEQRIKVVPFISSNMAKLTNAGHKRNHQADPPLSIPDKTHSE